MKKSILLISLMMWIFTAASDAQCYFPAFVSEISESERNSLRRMREEEKMAHDVYSSFAEQYGARIFENISRSEMRHTTAVKALLDRYGLEDPAAGTSDGEFIIPEIRSLYNDLILQGSESWEAAIIAGLTIEDHDIAELMKALEEEVDNEDIRLVYQNLLRGSRNHMKAFWFHAGRCSLDYQLQYISRELFEEIVGGSGQASR